MFAFEIDFQVVGSGIAVEYSAISVIFHSQTTYFLSRQLSIAAVVYHCVLIAIIVHQRYFQPVELSICCYEIYNV